MDRDREDSSMKVEGERAKRFGIFLADINGEPEGRFDTYEGVVVHCKRLDKLYRIQVNRKYLTLDEFKQQFAPKTTVAAPYAIVEKVRDAGGNFTRAVRTLSAYDSVTEAHEARDRLAKDLGGGVDEKQDYGWVLRGDPPKEYRYFVEPLTS